MACIHRTYGLCAWDPGFKSRQDTMIFLPHSFIHSSCPSHRKRIESEAKYIGMLQITVRMAAKNTEKCYGFRLLLALLSFNKISFIWHATRLVLVCRCIVDGQSIQLNKSELKKVHKHINFPDYFRGSLHCQCIRMQLIMPHLFICCFP